MCKPSSPILTAAIVGKPNVGKSSLFNRIIKKRKAIISDEPGVTRDINYETVCVNDIVFRLADSAGISKGVEEIRLLGQRMNHKLINEAHLILFLCEIDTMSSEDFDIAERIRKSGKPYIWLINKVDSEKKMNGFYDFFDLALESPLPISVHQGKNIDELMQRIGTKLQQITLRKPFEPKSEGKGLFTGNKHIRVAIVGRPNVGKSSLLNLLVNSERSLVTPTPGTTRDSVDETISFECYEMKLVDTAGVRKRSKIRENVDFYSLVRTENAVRESTICVLITDATAGITMQDKKIASLIRKEKKGLIIAANKWDLAQDHNMKQKEFIRNLYDFFPHAAYASVIPLSAKTGYNKIKLLKNIIKVYNNYHMHIKTGELNAFMRKFELRGVHVKYGYQKSSAPPVFEFFVGRIETYNRNFKRFITNSLRKSFDFTGVPIDVILRKN
jgi:GTP-binding protein